MTKQVQRRRGTATQHTSFTGAEGELSVNTTNKSVHVHDNVTAGGFEAARADMDNVTSSSILTAAGITATTAELNYVDGVTSNIQTQLDGKAGTASPTFTGTLTTANLTATGTTTLAGASTSADITFGDNDKAVFGAGSDLQIYHDGSHSYIKELGGGNLSIMSDGAGILMEKTDGENIAFFDTVNSNVELFEGGTKRLETTSTGVDITGVLTSDGLTVEGAGAGLANFYRASANANFSAITFKDTTNTSTNAQIGWNANELRLDGTNTVRQVTGGLSRMLIGSNGDISFYEDTGTTPKFFWDASAESLGIGDTGPLAPLFVNGNETNITDLTAVLWARSKTGASIPQMNVQGDQWQFGGGGTLDTSPTMTIDYGSNSVGIGTSSPRVPIDVAGAGATTGGVTSHAVLSDTASFAINKGGLLSFEGKYNTAGNPASWASIGGLKENATDGNYAGYLQFNTRANGANQTEAMRIDSSGKLLVGKTADDNTSIGLVVNGNGFTKIVRASGTANVNSVLQLNRLSSDGDIAVFQKDSTTVGSIGVAAGGGAGCLYICNNQSGNAGLYFAGRIQPTDHTGDRSDNTVDLGSSSFRFDDIYATNGTIQTSDRNEKQDIAELSDAEQRVAVAAKGLMRKFRWKDAVAEKGDEARTHFGIIAQDLQAAFAAEGLDAGDYAMFISTTWTDEETGEERTRMGVRYSELLAFIIGAL